MATEAVPPPLPLPNLDDKPHWDGLRRHELLIQKCADCGALRHPPRPICHACRSGRKEWVKASGRGVVYSYTIVPQATHPAWRDKVPYAVVIVELEEDVRLVSNLEGVPNEQIKVGLPVEIVYDDVAPDVTLPKFRVRK
ncbi:MAG: Zn-ribbon domain-containing OB-fold protein [SAR202 cluster bacterium]|nr:Zn-ribbon domain-containing OB-fold protein [SAR202 cluster bacterium]